MGLDIYLYRYDNFEDTEARENKYTEFSEKLWNGAGDYDSLTQEQKDELRNKDKEFAKSLNLDEWGTDESTCEQIELDHPDYPNHYFKIGYFRSSYNSSGIERILRNLGVPTLSDIFRDNDEYKFQPDWDAALAKCEVAINLLKEKGAYRVNQVSANIFRESSVKSEKDALDIFLKNLEKDRDSDMRSYSNADGEFYLDEPLEVVAMIPGKTTLLREQDCVYVVTKSDNEWYVQALEIVRDTIKHVLSQENKNQYYLHWSG